MPSLIYWIKFDGRQPSRISAKTFLELIERINYEVQVNKQPFEWLIRDYK